MNSNEPATNKIWHTQEQAFAIAGLIVAIRGAFINACISDPSVMFKGADIVALFEHIVDRQGLREHIDIAQDEVDALGNH